MLPTRISPIVSACPLHARVSSSQMLPELDKLTRVACPAIAQCPASRVHLSRHEQERCGLGEGGRVFRAGET